MDVDLVTIMTGPVREMLYVIAHMSHLVFHNHQLSIHLCTGIGKHVTLMGNLRAQQTYVLIASSKCTTFINSN